jgi:dihydroorotase/N-acyl-D-amino-acid deacylase
MRVCGFLLLLGAAGCAGPVGRTAATPEPTSARYDLVLEGGRVVDGTGAAWFHADLGIRGDRIAIVAAPGALASAPARERLDARGLVVAPGFIDIQGQSGRDFTTGDGRVISKVTQGITTEILGEGGTPAPLPGRTPPRPGPDFRGPQGFGVWLRTMEAHGNSVNVGSFLGASTVRAYAKGQTEGPATPAELDTMRAVVRGAMEAGAFGIGSALIYPPGSYASTAELIELARAMAPFGGVYITHLRSEGNAWLEAIDEAIRIGREGGVPVEIYHLKAGGTRNWAKAEQAIARIEAARATGLDVQADMYAYTAGATGLSACLPPWTSADGRLFDRLADPATRRRIQTEMEQVQSEWENLCELGGPENVLLLLLDRPENARFSGRRLSEVAQALGKPWSEAAMDLILSERSRVETAFFLMSEENVRRKLQLPWMKFGTDASGHDPATASGLTHPRAYGNYPRILGKYVRDEGVLTLEEAIRKSTSAVATRLGIPDRGLIQPGFHADLAVFDPATIADRATFEQPHQLSIGVRHVIVNGTPVLRDGVHTGATPGRIVRPARVRPAGAP